MLMRWTLRIALVVVALPLFAASAKFEPYVFKTQDGQSVDAELGSFTVPENRTKPNSRNITIRFVRFKSTSSKPGHPIVYLAGGPGGSGIGALSTGRFAIANALREFGDVIAYDQRGINQSEPDTRCTEEYTIAPGTVVDRAKTGSVMADAVRRCAARLSTVDTTALNTRENAADLNDLRAALGAQKLVLWGISYGTHLGIATLRYHPDAIDRVILAGIEGPDDTYKLPSDQQTLLEEIARIAPHHDLLAAINKVTRELEARPKRVTLTHPMTGTSAEYVLGKLDLQRVLADMLTGPDSFAALPDFIARLEQGDWTALGLAAGRGYSGTAPALMSVAMDCASGISAARTQRIAAEAKLTLLGDAINLPFPEVCAGVKFEDAGDAFRGPLVTDKPALLISGTLDGRTRPRQAEELRATMPNAQHVVIVGAGHSDPLFLSSPKILEAMKTFLRGETIRDRYIQLPPVQFLPMRKVASVPVATLAAYAGAYRFDNNVTRRVLAAGDVLYTIREGQPPFPIRPLSATEFFYEFQPGTVRFEKDAMIYIGADGKEQRGTRVQSGG
jgi:pimeloyl-ACP methyl ester carboxylesterase